MRKLTLIFTMFAITSSSSFAKEVVLETDKYERKGSDYTNVIIDTNYEPKYPLQTGVTFEFHASIRTVGQSLNYILDNSGYRLEDLQSTHKETLTLYTLEVPFIHWQFYNSTIM